MHAKCRHRASARRSRRVRNGRQPAARTGNYQALGRRQQRGADAFAEVNRCRNATPACTRPVPRGRLSAPKEYCGLALRSVDLTPFDARVTGAAAGHAEVIVLPWFFHGMALLAVTHWGIAMYES